MLSLRRLAMLLTVFATFIVAGAARAEEIQIHNAILELTDEGPSITADFRLELPAKLEEALLGGVPLYFIVECEVARPRWYWLDERVTTAVTRYRLSYHAITREYRLSSGALHYGVATLAEGLRLMTALRTWVIADRAQLRPATTYEAWLRMRLDTSQLPRPLQVAAFGQRDWALASPWQKWQFIIPDARTR